MHEPLMFLVHVLNSIAAAVNVKFGPINVDSENTNACTCTINFSSSCLKLSSSSS